MFVQFSRKRLVGSTYAVLLDYPLKLRITLERYLLHLHTIFQFWDIVYWSNFQLQLQQGIGRKLSDVIQLTAQVIGSFAVAFYLCWKLTIVLLAAFPAIVISAAYMINAITAATTKSLGSCKLCLSIPTNECVPTYYLHRAICFGRWISDWSAERYSNSHRIEHATRCGKSLPGVPLWGNASRYP